MVTYNGPAPAVPQFDIDERAVGRRVVLSVSGEVDISTCAELRAAIESAGSRAFEVLLDLSDTTFMDSTGLHTMLRAQAGLADDNVRLALVCPAGPVLRLLTLTGLDRMFEIDPSRSAAEHEHAITA
jgi:anti-sigma B factor antagonist